MCRLGNDRTFRLATSSGRGDGAIRGCDIANLRASSDPLESVVLDVDSLPIEVHRYRCFPPLCASIRETGDITGLWLRGGEVHTAAMADEMADEIIVEAVELVEHYIAPVRAVRLDVLEARELPYLARLRKYLGCFGCVSRSARSAHASPSAVAASSWPSRAPQARPDE